MGNRQDQGPRWRGENAFPEYEDYGLRFEQQRYGQGPAEYRQRRQTRGPKGYKRSDERVREDVCDRLSQSWDLDASEVEVTVSGGEVTLRGTIADRDQKFRAESIADSVGGVSEVHNQLRVRRDSMAQASPQPSQAARPSTTNPSRCS